MDRRQDPPPVADVGSPGIRAEVAAAALDGVRVADFTRVLAGPYATMLLADLGADVIKIERPDGGDDTRAWGPPFGADGMSTYFAGVNRNKRSVALDLTDPRHLVEAQRLVSTADVVIENFRTGVMDRLGLGYSHVHGGNPGIIYCSITGFGSEDGAELPGYDLVVQAVGGLMSVTGPDAQHPSKAGIAVADVFTGLHACVGILSALQHRNVTGRGQRIEVNLMSSLLSAMVNLSSGYLGAGSVPTAVGNGHPSIAPYDLYRTADRPLIIAVGNDRQFRSLCDVIGMAWAAEDPRFQDNMSRVQHRAELDEELNRRLEMAVADDWQQRLTSAGIPCGPVNSMAQAFALADSLRLGSVVQPPTGMPQAANPLRMSDTPPTYRLGPPDLGGVDPHEVAGCLMRGQRKAEIPVRACPMTRVCISFVPS